MFKIATSQPQWNSLVITECVISYNISFSLCDLTDLISHLGLHNRSMGPVTGVTACPSVFI